MATADANEIRDYSEARGREVTWEEKARLLDIEDAAYRGSNASVRFGAILVGEVSRNADPPSAKKLLDSP